MTLWRKTRNEMAGAYRSLQYDLGRRDQPEPSPEPPHDHTSTGMSTFGGDFEAGESKGPTRTPRRAAAVAAFGTLAVAGAAGSYFAVVNGLGAMLTDEPAQPEPYPLAIAGTSGEAASNAGLGRGSAPRPGQAGAATTLPTATTAAGVPVPRTAQPAPPKPAVPRTTPAKPGTTPSEDCDCLSPPVPTPTSVPSSAAPTSEPASPEPTDSASAEPTPTDSASEEPSPSENPHAGRRHRHR